MLDYSFHSLAQEEFEGAALYYESRSENLGMAFVDCVSSAISIIRQFPEIGTPEESGTRQFGVETFPYSVVYRRDGETIRVIAIAAHDGQGIGVDAIRRHNTALNRSNTC